jgi:transitional endoplasmic reticulum ATPase
MPKSTTKDREVENVSTVHSDVETILIPTRMTKLQAAEELRLQHEEEEKVVEKVRIFEHWDPRDAIVAAMRVANQTFGWINAKPTQDMFGNEIQPKQIKVQTDVNEHEDCFRGQFVAAAWDKARIDIDVNGRHSRCMIIVEGKRKFSERVDAFFDAIEEELKNNSIYKGKTLMWSSDEGFNFIENKGTEDIILNENEQLVLDNFIIKPLKQADVGKRGVLFTGPYGTGKTETALKIGRIANEEGQTFIYVKDRNLAEALDVAKNYQPAVIFIEDIDEMTSGDRSEAINDLLNTIDGIQTKGQPLTLLMTTNHQEKINSAFRRPGRIDVILNFALPTKETVAKMYERFLGGAKLNYKKLAEATPEVQGAVIKEIANRALLSVDEGKEIKDKNVLTSIELTRMQVDFMKEEHKVEEPSIDKQLTKMLKEVVVDPIEEQL